MSENKISTTSEFREESTTPDNEALHKTVEAKEDVVVVEASSGNKENPDDEDSTHHESWGKNKKKLKRIPPNWFLALQISNDEILRRLSSIQDHIVEQEPRLKAACVPINKSHLTLMVFNSRDEQLSEVETLIEEAVDEFRSCYHEPIDVQVQGMDHFRDQVVFAKVNFPAVDEEQKFTTLWNSIAERLCNAGFLSKRDANIADFKRHVTLLKMSRAPELRRKNVKKISGELYSTMTEHNFGDDSFASVQLLSMNKPVSEETGYYFCQREFPLSSRKEKESGEDQVKILESSSSSIVVESLSVQKAKVRQTVCEAVLLSASKYRNSENPNAENLVDKETEQSQ